MKKYILSILTILFSLNIIFAQNPTEKKSLELINAQIENLRAQTLNQNAQTELNKKQTILNTVSPFATSLVSLIGGGFLIAWFNNRSDKKKNRKLAEEERKKAIRLASADLLKATAEGFNCLTWILWIAKNTPNDFENKLVREHNEKMNKIYNDIAGFQVVLAAYSKELYNETEPIVEKLFHCDGVVNRIFPCLKNRKQSSLFRLGKIWKPIYIYGNNIPKEFSKILEKIIPQ